MSKKNQERPAWTERPVHFDPNADYRFQIGRGVTPPPKSVVKQQPDSSLWTRASEWLGTALRKIFR